MKVSSCERVHIPRNQQTNKQNNRKKFTTVHVSLFNNLALSPLHSTHEEMSKSWRQ